jgi:hypothetical protein
MAKLILSFENTVLKTVHLNKERITIGRRPENDIQVDNLAVSGLHAVVTTLLNDSVIEDLNSTNGTLINGQLLQKRLLQHNDVIEIGKHRIKYVVEAVAATSYQDFAKTMVIRRPDAATPQLVPVVNTSAVPLPEAVPVSVPDVATANLRPIAAPAPISPRRDASLEILSGTAMGRVLDLNKSLTTVGKAGVQVAVFTRRPMGYFLTHVEGDVFPLVNGVPLGTHAMQLNEQDIIDIAGTKMRFFNKP